MPTSMFPPILPQRYNALPLPVATMDITFIMPQENVIGDLQHIEILVYEKNSGRYIALAPTDPPAPGTILRSPDGVVYRNIVTAGAVNTDRQILLTQVQGDVYTIQLRLTEWYGANLQENVEYCIQLRFGENQIWANPYTNFANWKRTQLNTNAVGEWSGVAELYFIQDPLVTLVYLPAMGFIPNFRVSVNIGPEGVKSYRFLIQVDGQEPYYTPWKGVTGNSNVIVGNSSTIITEEINYFLLAVGQGAPGFDTEISFEYITVHGYTPVISPTITKPNCPTENSGFFLYPIETNIDDGYVGLGFVTPEWFASETPVSVTIPVGEEYYIYKITDREPNAIQLVAALGGIGQTVSTGLILSKDLFAEAGTYAQYFQVKRRLVGANYVYYLSELIPINYNPGEVINAEFIFGGIAPPVRVKYWYHIEGFNYQYFTTSDRQLKLAYNFTISSFKRNINQQQITTIGNRYPYIMRNAKVDYLSFSFNSIVSILKDLSYFFLKPKYRLADLTKFDLWYKNKTTGEEKVLVTYEQLFGEGTEIYFDKIRTLDDYERQLVDGSLYTYGLEPGKINDSFTPDYGNLDMDSSVGSFEYGDGTVRGPKSFFDVNPFVGLGSYIGQVNAPGNLPLTRAAMTTRFPLTTDSLQVGDYMIVNQGVAPLAGQRVYYTITALPGANITWQTAVVVGANGQLVENLYDFTPGEIQEVNLLSLNPTFVNIEVERKFREAALDYLTNTPLMVYRSSQEGNILISLSNISLTPLDATRLLYTISGDATEVGEYKYENLLKYKILDPHMNWSI